MKTFLAVAGLVSLGLATPALAASDLVVSIDAPSGLFVYDNGTYGVDVSNIGNKNANNVSLTIQLPETNTSPGVHIMGDLTGFSSSCSQSGTELTCSLGRIRKNKTKSVWLDLMLPYSEAPIVIEADVSTTSSENSTSNNDDAYTAVLDWYAIAISAPTTVVNSHCTGQGLTSFWECVVSPGSISSHTVDYLADGTIYFPQGGGYTGWWNQPTPDTLEFQYLQGTTVVADFSGVGADGGCFEGVTVFPGSPWVAPYEVCP